MEEEAALEAAFRRRIARASRNVADAKKTGDHAVAGRHAARLEDAFELALRFKLDDRVPNPGRTAIPRPRTALSPA
ncbi:hypothetical protein [Amycolatopsis australiensis]|uniref:Uncharacterized protein n=1 Tax=Amycolatopsis australiensis TaxID=546364 RepID=A0A1K1S3J1_9PSEU|nr:hypothetical protein [Amycolatopsis australiensis]SFW78905.1 hypothetical protein SAMN04489730_4617 [Amycolatopsis australiensis]